MPRLRPVRHLPPSSTKARIGLFGGSFDPPHMGHMHVAETALKRLALDEVWWLPARGNPLKSAPGDYAVRLAAVQVMTAANGAMKVSDVEAHAHLTYSVDVVRLFKAHCPRASLVWIMGSDNLMRFHHWKDWQTLARLIPIAVVARPGATLAARASRFAGVFREARLPRRMSWQLARQSAPAWTYLTAPLNPLSSTALRGGKPR